MTFIIQYLTASRIISCPMLDRLEENVNWNWKLLKAAITSQNQK